MQAISVQSLHTLHNGFYPLSSLPLVVLVGVTGVGKSTTLEHLAQLRPFELLPDRRELTDAFIFGGEKIADRTERFRRTRAFREQHPGGMAAVLAQLTLEQTPSCPVLFDGLRGLEEVKHAAQFDGWRFVLLDAPDFERARRLIGRGDVFDNIVSNNADVNRAGANSVALEGEDGTLETLKALEGVYEVFTERELLELSQINSATWEIVSKIKIVLEERRNYDPRAARDYLLETLDFSRVIYLDTLMFSPLEVAGRLLEWL